MTYNINNSNTNNIDYLFSNFKNYNDITSNNNIDLNILKKDVIKYKKEIKNKINKLYSIYTDSSGNIDDQLNLNNNNEKYNIFFSLFLSNIIENIKKNKINKSIQEDLKNFNNTLKDSNIDESFNNISITNNILLDNKNNTNKKVTLLDINFVKKKVTNNNKILPKVRE